MAFTESAWGASHKINLRVVGGVNGLLRFPFADPETLEGALTPTDLATTPD